MPFQYIYPSVSQQYSSYASLQAVSQSPQFPTSFHLTVAIIMVKSSHIAWPEAVDRVCWCVVRCCIDITIKMHWCWCYPFFIAAIFFACRNHTDGGITPRMLTYLCVLCCYYSMYTAVDLLVISVLIQGYYSESNMPRKHVPQGIGGYIHGYWIRRRFWLRPSVLHSGYSESQKYEGQNVLHTPAEGTPQ